MSKKQNSKEEIIIPLGLLIPVVVIWLIAAPLSVYLVLNKTTKDSSEVLGVDTGQAQMVHSQDADLEELPLESSETTDAVEEKVYSLSICLKNLCRNIFNGDFRSLIVGDELDEVNFTAYMKENVYPYFDGKYAKKSVVKNSKGEFQARVEDELINYDTLFEKVNTAYLNGESNMKIELDYTVTAGTDGKYASKYIEVDNSQQKLYVWDQGEITKTIELSGPVYGFQVYGVFNIVDKGREPIAPGGKHMPYWMAFYHSKKQDSWYGFHALIWGFNEDGSKWYEPERNIGTRQSAGCIRMRFEDAKWLYENFEKGDTILIHE